MPALAVVGRRDERHLLGRALGGRRLAQLRRDDQRDLVAPRHGNGRDVHPHRHVRRRQQARYGFGHRRNGGRLIIANGRAVVPLARAHDDVRPIHANVDGAERAGRRRIDGLVPEQIVGAVLFVDRGDAGFELVTVGDRDAAGVLGQRLEVVAAAIVRFGIESGGVDRVDGDVGALGVLEDLASRTRARR